MKTARPLPTPFDCNLVIDRPAFGPWNMAVDETLLAAAADDGIATLRLYQWSEPTLSLGYFQKYDDRHAHPASRACGVVRRQTGGGAILHDRELTYSLALPASHPLARHAPQLYQAVHEAFVALLQPLVDSHCPGWALQVGDSDPQREDAFLCFQRRARGDVVFIPSANNSGEANWKVLGSAQRRQRGALLQHGSLLLERSPLAPELPGIASLTGIELSFEGLARDLPAQLSRAIGLLFKPETWSIERRQAVERRVAQKYDSPDWTGRR